MLLIWGDVLRQRHGVPAVEGELFSRWLTTDAQLTVSVIAEPEGGKAGKGGVSTFNTLQASRPSLQIATNTNDAFPSVAKGTSEDHQL